VQANKDVGASAGSILEKELVYENAPVRVAAR